MRGAASCGQLSSTWQPAQMKFATPCMLLADSGNAQALGSVTGAAVDAGADVGDANCAALPAPRYVVPKKTIHDFVVI